MPYLPTAVKAAYPNPALLDGQMAPMRAGIGTPLTKAAMQPLSPALVDVRAAAHTCRVAANVYWLAGGVHIAMGKAARAAGLDGQTADDAAYQSGRVVYDTLDGYAALDLLYMAHAAHARAVNAWRKQLGLRRAKRQGGMRYSPFDDDGRNRAWARLVGD